MKKSTLSIIAGVLSSLGAFAQVNIVATIPNPTGNGTSPTRAPNGTVGHTVLRAQYFVPAADLAAITTPTISSFGFVLTSGTGAPASGTLAVYLQTTAATSYTGGLVYNTAGMTNIYTGTYNVPTSAGPVDLQLPSIFNYVPGTALNVAYEYTAAIATSTLPAVYTMFTASPTVLGATGAVSSLTAVATLTLGNTTFRPLLRFGTPNSIGNDISVDYISSPQRLSTKSSTTHAIKALVANNSNTVINNVAVGVSVTGAVTHTNAVIIPSLAAGATSLVTFSPFNMASTLTGVTNVSVSVLPDQANFNNVKTITQFINCKEQAAGPDVTGSLFGNGIGFNTGSGFLANRMSFDATGTIEAISIAISNGATNAGNSTYAAVINGTGGIVATTNTIVLAPANYSTYTSYTLATPFTVTPNTDYYIGLAQTSNTVGYFPVASFTSATNVPPMQTLYSIPLVGGNPAPQQSSLGFLGIKAIFQGSCLLTGGVKDIKNNIVNMNVYPNPAKDNLTVSIANVDNASINIINALGQVVLSVSKATETNSINTSNLTTGVYFVTVTNGSQKSTQKLVIEK